MKLSAPWRLHAFVICLGIAINFAAGLFNTSVRNSIVAAAISVGVLAFTYGYAVHVSYRRGCLAAMAHRKAAGADQTQG